MIGAGYFFFFNLHLSLREIPQLGRIFLTLYYNTVQLRIFGTNFRPVETRNFASLPRFLGLTELYCSILIFINFTNKELTSQESEIL
ncbi:hypothetical protein GXM_04584 [Nostoc sphaeroides CCNUC1]|uniref:Uncharacterized protein n=1 Tax=Nostoc sphaeroides CCNUC1 TaxID=2653204 RepID=A0A5P8W335_9NOSO|nr:hypothetical protein GXM_04584 [Nostoc sphaeroides CCNUC1]